MTPKLPRDIITTYGNEETKIYTLHTMNKEHIYLNLPLMLVVDGPHLFLCTESFSLVIFSKIIVYLNFHPHNSNEDYKSNF